MKGAFCTQEEIEWGTLPSRLCNETSRERREGQSQGRRRRDGNGVEDEGRGRRENKAKGERSERRRDDPTENMK